MKLNQLLFSGIIMFILSSFMQINKTATKVYPAIQSYLLEAEKDFTIITNDRKAELQKIADYIVAGLKAEKKVNLVFICTHNSRRSQMGQLWADAAAAFYGINGVNGFLGGTEATAFNERAVKALRNAGFIITQKTMVSNPEYAVQFADNLSAITCFSKKYYDSTNPTTAFAAIMTCSQADKNCPFVRGATARIGIHYEDPKLADGTPEESMVYQQRCKQIATEMLYAFSLVKKSK